jgi:hypothetical protein
MTGISGPHLKYMKSNVLKSMDFWSVRRNLNPQLRDYESNFALFCTGQHREAQTCIRYLVRISYKIMLRRAPLHGGA